MNYGIADWLIMVLRIDLLIGLFLNVCYSIKRYWSGLDVWNSFGLILKYNRFVGSYFMTECSVVNWKLKTDLMLRKFRYHFNEVVGPTVYNLRCLTILTTLDRTYDACEKLWRFFELTTWAKTTEIFRRKFETYDEF